MLRKTVFTVLKLGKSAFHAMQKCSLNYLIKLNSRAKRQYTNFSGFDVKSKARQNGPCSSNVNSSTNQFWEKRFSQSKRSVNSRFITYKTVIIITQSSWIRKQNGGAPIYQVLTSDRTYGKMGPVHQILILHHLIVEKNGFDCLRDQ